jgi:hypothetical protein
MAVGAEQNEIFKGTPVGCRHGIDCAWPLIAGGEDMGHFCDVDAICSSGDKQWTVAGRILTIACGCRE